MKKYLTAFSFIAIAILTGCIKEIQSNQQPATINELSVISQANIGAGGPGENYVPNELLVKFKAGTSQSARADVLSRISGNVQEHVVTNAMAARGDREGFFVVHTPLQALDAISKSRGLAEVEYAEPNWIYTYGATATDPYFTDGSLWGMNDTYGIHADQAWGRGHTGSANVYVGIIDEGIQFDHPELQGQVWTNPFDALDGTDNDGNGYVDDIHGWDFDGNNNSIYDGGSRGNLDDHGTHVSGTIGANMNGLGVVGVNWHVTLISGKFLGRRGGTTANAVKAVDYFTDLKSRHSINIVATNNSWGGGGFSASLYDAISRANDKGILFVAAAGNGGSDGVGDNNDKVANFPSNYDITNIVSGKTYTGLPNIIAVAAIGQDGKLASFSNYGTNSVHLGAPGVGIWSSTAYNMLSSYSGTSMATPHVTGAVALYAATNNLTPTSAAGAAAIKNAITINVTPNILSGKCSSGGILNVSSF